MVWTEAAVHPSEHTGDDARMPALVAWSREVRAATHRLDPTQSRVLEMIYFDRRSQDEVARSLSLSRRAVARSAAAGLQALAAAVLARGAD